MVRTMQARRIGVRGVVQGVGFRPFVYHLARENGLNGWVCNTSGDVTIIVEGGAGQIDRFLAGLKSSPPPRSSIDSISEVKEPFRGYTGFEILTSQVREDEYQPVSPDLATCPNCKSEIFDPADRRRGYPFTNCTNCGPRFTIIQDIPYDRQRTTMHRFKMCPDCRREYEDVNDRRFHAQPNACPVCGPELELAGPDGSVISRENVIARAARLLREGNIVAVKGLGGFLLACDAASDEAVGKLRERKRRPAKPFAVMLNDLDEVRRYCRVSPREAEALGSPASPIVLLKMKGLPSLAAGVAPGLDYLGVMLPYTPLHHLLMNEAGIPLVMTSGNLSEEPIAKDNAEAVSRLQGIADYFILHNRDIYSRYDDSVVAVEQGEVRILRRARGYAPAPIHLPFSSGMVLACGAELKNTFCLTRGSHAFVSQHIGDLENEETLAHFEETVELYQKLFRIRPEIIACDLHPDYLSTGWAENAARRDRIPLVRIQHHHAHIASCMADNGITGPVIGAALDGTGYGTDGKIWGGEFLIGDLNGFRRAAHLEYLPLPGGEAAVRKPVRTAAGYLYYLLGEKALAKDIPGLRGLDEYEAGIIRKQTDLGLNTPLTSSCGRLFDAVSALLGIRQQVEYEGQAAVELEMAAGDDMTGGVYPFRIEDGNGALPASGGEAESPKIIRVGPMLEAILDDIRRGVPVEAIAAHFHNTIACVIIEVCLRISHETGIRQAALSGGVFQNRRLLRQVVPGLKERGLVPLLHKNVPCNDGGVSLGQAVLAEYKYKKSGLRI